VGEWRKEQLSIIIEGHELKHIYNVDETGMFFRLSHNEAVNLKGDPYNHGKNSKESILVLLACNAYRTDKLPPLVIGKSESPCWFKNVRKFPTKYIANRKARVT
jgi:hypothetical protein